MQPSKSSPPLTIKPTTWFFSPYSLHSHPLPCPPHPSFLIPTLHSVTAPFFLASFFPFSNLERGGLSEWVSLDILNSSWHAVSQLHLLRWTIVQTMSCTTILLLVIQQRAHTDGQRHAPWACSHTACEKNACSDVMPFRSLCLPAVSPPVATSCLSSVQKLWPSRLTGCLPLQKWVVTSAYT